MHSDGKMKRDMDLIRQLLLRLEAMDIRPRNSISPLTAQDIPVDGYTEDEIAYHLDLIIEARLIENHNGQPAIGITFTRLSWEGHDFLDSIRSLDVWQKTKSDAAAAGGFTVDLLKSLALAIVKSQIKTHTGLEI